jgi:hypothetical protein
MVVGCVVEVNACVHVWEQCMYGPQGLVALTARCIYSCNDGARIR